MQEVVQFIGGVDVGMHIGIDWFDAGNVMFNQEFSRAFVSLFVKRFQCFGTARFPNREEGFGKTSFGTVKTCRERVLVSVGD